jgi:hypothetical protein
LNKGLAQFVSDLLPSEISNAALGNCIGLYIRVRAVADRCRPVVFMFDEMDQISCQRIREGAVKRFSVTPLVYASFKTVGARLTGCAPWQCIA